MPDMIPENDPYDMATTTGAFEDEKHLEKTEDGERLRDPRLFLSMRDDLSLVKLLSWSLDSVSGTAVRIVGSLCGTSKGDKGGVSTGNAILPYIEYSAI